jgi:hypothetical protein
VGGAGDRAANPIARQGISLFQEPPSQEPTAATVKNSADGQFGGGFPHPSTWPVNGMTLSVPFAGKSVFVPGYNGVCLALSQYHVQ